MTAPTTAPAEYWQHPFYSAVDHQLDPLLEVIRDRATDPGEWGWSPVEVRGALGAVRAALDVLERDLAPGPDGAVAELERQHLAVGPVHQHTADGDGSWCVRVGPPSATRLLWHLAFVPSRRHEAHRRRISGPRGWVRTSWGDAEAALALAIRILDRDDPGEGLVSGWEDGG